MKCGESDGRNKTYLKNFSEEKFFQQLIPESAPLILDIGAHTGESVEFFSSIFKCADIYSVEPDPESYAKLVKIHWVSEEFAPVAGVGMGVGSKEVVTLANFFASTTGCLSSAAFCVLNISNQKSQ